MSAPLSDEDRAFIRAILNNPAELTGWLAYADWLDERNDPRAEFVRLQIQFLNPDSLGPNPFTVLERLDELRSKLDRDWVVVFERPYIENCDEEFAFKCPKKWEQLKGTDKPRERYCDTCDKKVYYCLTDREAQGRARLGLCVALSPAVAPRPFDLAQPEERGQIIRMGLMGLPDDVEHDHEPEPPRKPWWKFW